MARKKRKFEKNAHPADGHMMKMKYTAIKRECVIRGMPFKDAVSVSIPKLASFFRKHFYDDIDHSLLDKYDNWVESQIKDKNLCHPSLRLGYIGEEDKDGVTKKKRVKTIAKKKKKKRERTDDNVFRGTKKALAFELQGKGKTKEEVVTEVMAKFPDANKKSIGIWFNKARKQRANSIDPINYKK